QAPLPPPVVQRIRVGPTRAVANSARRQQLCRRSPASRDRGPDLLPTRSKRKESSNQQVQRHRGVARFHLRHPRLARPGPASQRRLRQPWPDADPKKQRSRSERQPLLRSTGGVSRRGAHPSRRAPAPANHPPPRESRRPLTPASTPPPPPSSPRASPAAARR